MDKVIHTEDVLKSLTNFASNNNLNFSDVDFDILSVTYFSVKKSKTFKVQELSSIKESIIQRFKIKVFKIEKRHFLIAQRIFVHKDNHMAYISISSKSKIIYYDDLENEFIDYLNKQKAKKGLLLNIFDDKMIEGAKIFVSKIKQNIQFKINTKIILISGIEYISTIQSKMVYDYLPPSIKSTDLSSCFVHVKKDEHFATYIKGSLGNNGLNIYGDFKKAEAVDIKKALSFDISNAIDTKDFDDKTHLISRASGILTYNNSKFDIRNSISFDSDDFKKVRYFNVPVDDDSIIVNIKSRKEFEDAVKAGVFLQAHTINIKGDIDSNVKLIAKNLNVDGYIHRNVKIKAENVNLKMFKGKLKAKKVKIKNFESALVMADSIEIDNASGGSIEGRNISINRIHSNTNIKCSNTLNITQIKGNGNNIIMTMSVDSEYINEIKNYTNSLKKLPSIDKKKFNSIMNKFKSYSIKQEVLKKQLLKDNTSLENRSLKEKLISNKASLSSIKKQISSIKMKQEITKKLKEIDLLLYQTKIILKNRWNGDTTITYEYVQGKKSERIMPKKSIDKITFEQGIKRDKIIY